MRLGRGSLGERGWHGTDILGSRRPVYSSHHESMYTWNEVAANKVFATPFQVAKLFKVGHICIGNWGYVSGPVGVNVGIYNDTGAKYPGTLVYCGNISVNAGHWFEHAPDENVFLNPKRLYWLAVQMENTGDLGFGLAPNGRHPWGILGIDASGSMEYGQNLNSYYGYEATDTYQADSLPDPYPGSASRITSASAFATLWLSAT